MLWTFTLWERGEEVGNFSRDAFMALQNATSDFSSETAKNPGTLAPQPVMYRHYIVTF